MANTDCFADSVNPAGFLWSPKVVAQHIHTTPSQYSTYDFAYDDSFNDKTRLMDISARVKMSFMGGLIKATSGSLTHTHASLNFANLLVQCFQYGASVYGALSLSSKRLLALA